jgi:hypothetical protein
MLLANINLPKMSVSNFKKGKFSILRNSIVFNFFAAYHNNVKKYGSAA